MITYAKSLYSILILKSLSLRILVRLGTFGNCGFADEGCSAVDAQDWKERIAGDGCYR